MPWSAITAGEVKAKLSPAEYGALLAIRLQGTGTQPAADTSLQSVLNVVVKEWVGAMAAAGYQVLANGTVPDQLRRHVVALVLWTWLKDFPDLTELFLTDARKDAAKKADNIYSQICLREYGAIESPGGADTTTGNWNSAPKLVGRMAPIPQPQDQIQQAPTPLYANPNSPPDSVPSNAPGLAQPPLNLTADPQDSQVLLAWDPSAYAVGYTVYWATAAGGAFAQLVTGLAATTYLHTGLANGQSYYYFVTATNAAGIESGPTIPVVVIPEPVNNPEPTD